MNPAPSPSPLLVDIMDGGSAPWWGVPVIAGVFLILGAAVGFWFNWQIESRKLSRIEAVRWDADIREYTAELISAERQLAMADALQAGFTEGFKHYTTKRINAMSDTARSSLLGERSIDAHVLQELQSAQAESETFRESKARQQTEWERVFTLSASLNLVAPDPVRSATESLVTALDKAYRLRGEPADKTSRVAVVEARKELVRAVRSHLGLPDTKAKSPEAH